MAPQPALDKRLFKGKVRSTNPTVSLIPTLPIVEIEGARLHAITEEECIEIVLNELDEQRDGWIVTMNLDHARRFAANSSYRHLAQKATLRVADGMPLIWASRLQGTPLPERVTGSNLIWSLSSAAARRNRSVFLLGGEPGTAEATGEILRSHYPSLKVAGTYCPELGFEKDPGHVERISDVLNAANPDIVYIALGSPKQDLLIRNLRKRVLKSWWLGVGISFSFIAGEVTRAPMWMQQTGLEWVHRLSQEPRRLTKRYLVDGLPFASKMLIGSAVVRTKQ